MGGKRTQRRTPSEATGERAEKSGVGSRPMLKAHGAPEREGKN
jgi:hypothetical protein